MLLASLLLGSSLLISPTVSFQIMPNETSCPVRHWKGDNICDDINNVEHCDYDGHDCCKETSDFSLCTKCACEGIFILIEENEEKNCNESFALLIGDSFCDDKANTPECNFDGGDCCGVRKSYQFCTDCTCNEQSMTNIGMVCKKPRRYCV